MRNPWLDSEKRTMALQGWQEALAAHQQGPISTLLQGMQGLAQSQAATMEGVAACLTGDSGGPGGRLAAAKEKELLREPKLELLQQSPAPTTQPPKGKVFCTRPLAWNSDVLHAEPAFQFRKLFGCPHPIKASGGRKARPPTAFVEAKFLLDMQSIDPSIYHIPGYTQAWRDFAVHESLNYKHTLMAVTAVVNSPAALSVLGGVREEDSFILQ
jgi:hypothetical protein